MKILGYRIRPVTRYVLTRSVQSDAGERYEPEIVGEFATEAKANEVRALFEVMNEVAERHATRGAVPLAAGQA